MFTLSFPQCVYLNLPNAYHICSIPFSTLLISEISKGGSFYFLVSHSFKLSLYSKTDLQLQMEAQRICLSLVYSAHVDQVCESLKAEKESALCSLKEELVHNHIQEMTDLKRMHQLELQTLKSQQAGNLTNIIRMKLCMKNSVLKKPNQTSSLCI